jgi:hypothetical protein
MRDSSADRARLGARPGVPTGGCGSQQILLPVGGELVEKVEGGEQGVSPNTFDVLELFEIYRTTMALSRGLEVATV